MSGHRTAVGIEHSAWWRVTVAERVAAITGAGDVPVKVDYISDAEWRSFAGRFPAGPQDAAPGPQDAPAQDTPPLPPLPDPAPTTARLDPPPPLYWAALATVRAHPDRALTPTALHRLLPDDVRPASVRALSLELAGQGWRSQLVRLHGVKDRFFLADDPAGTEPPRGSSLPSGKSGGVGSVPPAAAPTSQVKGGTERRPASVPDGAGQKAERIPGQNSEGTP